MHLLLLLAIIHLSSASLYFDLSASKPKCFIEDVLDKEAVIFLKWKIMPLSPISTQEKDTLLRNTLFYTYEDDTSKLVYQHVPTKEKSKTIFKAEKEGRYIICASFKVSYRKPPCDVQMNLKLSTENDEDQSFSAALKSEDVNKINMEMLSVASRLKPIIERQKNELDAEKSSAEETIKSTKWYKALTFIQIIVAVIVGLIQLNNFRRFLKSSHII